MAKNFGGMYFDLSGKIFGAMALEFRPFMWYVLPSQIPIKYHQSLPYCSPSNALVRLTLLIFEGGFSGRFGTSLSKLLIFEGRFSGGLETFYQNY